MAIDSIGNAHGWGSNIHGQLGIDALNENITYISQPTKLTMGGLKFKSIACGSKCSLFIHQRGNLYFCGSNE